ncbi:hypothetical protein LAWI1_G008538 [Lachnellula willkommii]|uniref:RED-like N-terminal domain-containing protein n=1 Tax=Lachnellula willkommii TaxID=215461 RepID=A0A559M1I0_9HELO|nr:hypothetical protein LAWI1_G008538 [Lachnellula willkommii]
MNNNQFRKLVLDTPARQASSSSPSDIKSTPARNGATPSALGSRMRSNIPMTPRTISGYSSTNDFARQLAERAQGQGQPATKKFKSSAAPKGAKLPTGYVDRAKAREGEEEVEEDDKVKRVKALEEMMKLQQIDEPTFVKLREEILGNEVGQRAGLVKGLDWKLLEKARSGEIGVMDVLEGKAPAEVEAEGGEPEVDVDDEFERLEDQEVEAVVKDKTAKKGEMASPSLTGRKRNRNQILADLKAARLAAKEAAQPSLGSRFKKVGAPRTESRIETDSKGREVLITVDEDGNEKRKVRKVQPKLEAELEKGHGLLMPDKDVAPLGMEVPEMLQAPEEEEEDINIFDDAGDDYDPLAGLEGSDSDEEQEDGEVLDSGEKKPEPNEAPKPVPGSMAPPPRPSQPRNYFGTSETTKTEGSAAPKGLSDPTLLAVLKKASTLNPISKEAENAEEAAKEARRKKMLQVDDRDAQDMDMGFGSSRFGDEEDFEEKKVKLSEWGSKGGDDDEEGGKGEGKNKRKRGPKKRKGDGNSATDVMKVLERRKGES